jgi:glyoxylase-like metal-dependent hydrolase (beta-lactamase superfamily II)
LQPYLDAAQVQTFEGETILFPGIRSIPAPGHTPGHTLYAIESEGQKLLLWGDLVHSEEIQLAHPEVAIKFDSDEPAAVRQRLKVLASAADENTLIGGAHIAFPGLGHLSRQGSGYAWEAVASAEKSSCQTEKPQ